MTIPLAVPVSLFLFLLPAVPAALLAWWTKGDPQSPKDRRAGIRIGLVSMAALFAFGAWLQYGGSPVWAVVVFFFGWLSAIGALAGLLHRASESWKFWLPLVAVLGAATGVANHAHEEAKRRLYEEQRRQAELEAREKEAAEALQKARRYWTPGSGVTELRSGRLHAWLAVAPQVAVDWPYEQDNAAAARQIPIRLVMLNNSFEELAPQAGAGGRWTVQVRRGGEAIASWRQDLAPFERSFAPAEKREIEIYWDGRSASGPLAPPGDYTVQASLDFGTLEAKLAIVDEGPEVILERDPVSLSLERQAENLAQMQRNMEFSRQLERMIDVTRNLRLPGR
jgi:hypothetical protein